MKIKIMLIAFTMLFVAGLQIMAQETCIHEDGSTGEIKTFYRPYSYKTADGVVHDCNYEVKVCVTCSDVQGKFRLELMQITAAPGCAITLGAYNAIMGFIRSESGYRQYCPPIIPPCDQGSEVHEVIEYFCWERIHVITGTFPNFESVESLIRCENSPYCIHHYEVCWDEAIDKYIRIRESFSVIGGEPSCPDNDYENPVFGTCLHFKTLCDLNP